MKELIYRIIDVLTRTDTAMIDKQANAIELTALLDQKRKLEQLGVI